MSSCKVNWSIVSTYYGNRVNAQSGPEAVGIQKPLHRKWNNRTGQGCSRPNEREGCGSPLDKPLIDDLHAGKVGKNTSNCEQYSLTSDETGYRAAERCTKKCGDGDDQA